MGKAENWSFGTRVTSDRRNKLMLVHDFDAVTSAILNEMRVADFTAHSGTKPILRGCLRAEFQVIVSCDTCDAFFNSPAGYRAQYYISTKLGIAINAILIQSLLPKLLNYALMHPEQNMTIDEVKKSLLLPQAKIWIREANHAVPFGDELIVDLLVDRWVTHARTAWDEDGANEQRNKAVRGVLAPVETVLEIKGGWLTKSGEECIDPEKARRAEDIAEYGYS